MHGKISYFIVYNNLLNLLINETGIYKRKIFNRLKKIKKVKSM